MITFIFMFVESQPFPKTLCVFKHSKQDAVQVHLLEFAFQPKDAVTSSGDHPQWNLMI